MKTPLELLGRERHSLYRKIGLLPLIVETSVYMDNDDLRYDIKYNYAYNKATRNSSYNTSNLWCQIFESTIQKTFNEIEEEALSEYLKVNWSGDTVTSIRKELNHGKR